MVATSSPTSSWTSSRIWFVLNTPIIQRGLERADTGTRYGGRVNAARNEHETGEVILDLLHAR